MSETTDRNALCWALKDLAVTAGAAILAIYRTDFEIRGKDDKSPVTDADEAAEKVILAGLRELAPEIPVVAEESVAAGRLPDISGGRFWLVDPLDGTKEFISRNGEFTVNIALVEAGSPTIGVVHLPAKNRSYIAAGPGAAFRQDGDGEPVAIRVRAPADDGLVVVASRSHRDSKTDDYLAGFTVKELISAGSSLKLCVVAEGSADMYPRLGRTMEWDIAAGQAVLNAAGGSVTVIDTGAPLAYGKDGLDNPFFVARGAM